MEEENSLIERLPTETLTTIFDYLLSGDDKNKAGSSHLISTCRRFREVALSLPLWKTGTNGLLDSIYADYLKNQKEVTSSLENHKGVFASYFHVYTYLQLLIQSLDKLKEASKSPQQKGELPMMLKARLMTNTKGIVTAGVAATGAALGVGFHNKVIVPSVIDQAPNVGNLGSYGSMATVGAIFFVCLAYGAYYGAQYVANKVMTDYRIYVATQNIHNLETNANKKNPEYVTFFFKKMENNKFKIGEKAVEENPLLLSTTVKPTL